MGTAREFHVKTGLTVDSGNVTLSSGNLVVNSGYIDIDNIKLDGQTISTVAGNDDINITPHGTGEVNISKVDIDAGAIDGTTIGATSASTGSFTSLAATGTSTLTTVDIGGGAIDGTTIGATTAAAGTFAALTGTGLDINGNADISGTTLMSGAISTGAAAADTTITQVNSAANAAGRTFTLQSGSPPTGGTDDTGVGGNLILAGGKGKGTAAGGSILFKVADGGSTGSSLNTLATALTIADDKSLTVAGTVTVGVDDTGHDVKFFGATSGNSMLWDESANQLKIVGTVDTVALDVDTGDFTVGAYGLTNAGAATISSMAGNWTNAGRTVADLGTVTTADIDGGTIDGVSIGVTTQATSIRGATVQGTTYVSGGKLVIDTNTVIDDNSFVMTPSTNDTVTIAAATNGALAITTVDAAGYDADIAVTADGDITLNTLNTDNSGNDARINFQYNSSTKVAIKSGATSGTPVLDVTGNVDISGSLIGPSSAAGVTNIKASGYIESGHARMRASDGIRDDVDLRAGDTSGTHHILDIDGTNFYSSDTLAVTEVSGREKIPGGGYATAGTSNGANTGSVGLVGLNIENTNDDLFQAVEAFCVMSIKNATGTIKKRVVNKIIAYVSTGGQSGALAVENYAILETGDTNLGKFHFVFQSESGGAGHDAMTLVFKYTSPYTHSSNDETSYSFNMNGLSLTGIGG